MKDPNNDYQMLNQSQGEKIKDKRTETKNNDSSFSGKRQVTTSTLTTLNPWRLHDWPRWSATQGWSPSLEQIHQILLHL